MTAKPRTPTPYRTGTRKEEARLRYAEWLATPESKRVPRTQNELAVELGVARSTLSSWRTLPLIQSIVSDWRNTYKSQFAAVMDAMFRRARSGNVAAARLLAEVFGELSPTKIEQTNIDGPFGQLLTDLRDLRSAEKPKPPQGAQGGLQLAGKAKDARAN